jgi:lysozyme
MDIVEQLTRDEGFRQFVYLDSAQKQTIGIGFNLTDVGISLQEAKAILGMRLQVLRDSLGQYAWYLGIDDIRQGAVLNMAYNLGIAGLLHFPHFIAALARKDYASAAQEMRNSVWYTQVGDRGARLAAQIETGVWA